MESSQIFSVIIGFVALLLSSFMNLWLKVLAERSFRSIDERLKALESAKSERIDNCESRIKDCDNIVRKLEQDFVRVELIPKQVTEIQEKMNQLNELRTEFLERLNEYIRRGDFIRDTQTMLNQMEIIYKKIDYVDAKIDKLRDR